MPLPFPAPAQAAGNIRAIGQMLLAGLFFAAMHAAVRYVANTGLHAFEIAFFRNLFGLLVVLPWVFRYGLAVLRTSRLDLHALRATVNTFGMLAGFYAFTIAPLSQVTALGFSGPIFATLFAIPLLGEKVGWHRWVAILIGFGGVLIALNPTAGAVSVGSLFALSGTLCWATTIIFVRKLSTTESPYTIVFYYMLTGSVIATCVMPWVWVTPTQEALVYYLGAGLVGALGQIAMTYALKLAPASVVSPFEYTQIAWAMMYDIVLWGVVPASTTLIGAAVVIVTGLYIFRREARQR